MGVGCGGLDQIMAIIPLALFFGLGRNLEWVHIFWIRVTSCRVYIRSASDHLRQKVSQYEKTIWKRDDMWLWC